MKDSRENEKQNLTKEILYLVFTIHRLYDKLHNSGTLIINLVILIAVSYLNHYKQQ